VRISKLCQFAKDTIHKEKFMKKMLQLMVVVLMGLMASACANKNIAAPFSPTDLNAKISSGDYVQKVDNFIVIFDDSSSMSLDKNWQSKLEQSKLVAINLNNTIPNLNLQSGFRAFGPRSYSLADGSPMQHGMTAYSKSGLEEAINSVVMTGGNTPMSRPIELASDDLAPTKGDIAVIIIGDGLENIGSPAAAAAQALKDKYKDRLCIYTILIGNDAAGRATMEQVAKAGECGFATDQEALSTPAGMASFVEQVFLKKGCKVAAPAPEAPAKQCFTVELNVEFDFDKATIKAEYYKTLIEFGDFIRKYPEHTVNLEGHTDNFGTDKYNIKLSQRRADSVRAFLLKNFSDISAARLTTVAHGLSQPIADNSTKAGRQKNRRVYATFTSMK